MWFNTISDSSWNIHLQKASSNEFKILENGQLLFNPSFQYLMVPMNDFKRIAQEWARGKD